MQENKTEVYEVTFICGNCKGLYSKGYPKGITVEQYGICPLCGCFSKDHKIKEDSKLHGKKEILLENS